MGLGGRVHVQHFHGDRQTWDQWPTIRKANPLVMVDPHTRQVILEERDEAREDTRLKARFMSYRLNVPSQDESEVLLSPDDWDMLRDRPVTERDGAPLVGIDLGHGRAWSAALAIFPSGRIEAFALAPGIPDIQAQERRDHVPAGLYQKLFNDGLLLLDDDLRAQRPETLWNEVIHRWGVPGLTIADRFRETDLLDAIGQQAPLESRVWRWSEASQDVRALRRYTLDGPFNVGAGADLIEASLAVTQVVNDDAGNTRLTKRGSNNTGRDDVCAAWMLAAGAYERMILNPPTPAAYHGLIQ